jgi:thioredoxin reductase (NADPH)
MERPRLLNIPGENLPHVSHYFDDPHPFFRRKLVIVGGKNSAVEAAIRCHRAGARVSLSYRGQAFNPKSVKYWLLPEIEGFIRQGHIGFHPATVPVEITDTGVVLKRVESEESFLEPADFILLLIGYEADTTLFRMLGVTLEGENRGPTHNPETMETNVPGVYVAGTAAAGTQVHFKLFIENAHVHVDRIVAHLTGQPVRERVTKGYTLPES